MKYSVFLIFFFISFNSWGFERFNIIFDIDYTLTHEVSSPVSKSIKLNIDGKYYRPNNWVLEGLEELAARKDVNIYFFSGGNELRNKELLKKLKLPESKKSLLSLSAGVYSKKHLQEISSSGSFGQRYKKNLKALGFDLNKTIIIDDFEDFVPASQKKNMLWIGKTYHHFESFKAAQEALRSSSLRPEYIPINKSQYFIAKNKFKFVFELLLESLDQASHQEVLSFLNTKKSLYIPYDDQVFSEKFKRIYGDIHQKPHSCFSLYRLFKYRN